MSTPNSVNLDLYERKKLKVLPLDVANTSVLSITMLVVGTLAIGWLWLVGADIFTSVVHGPQHSRFRLLEHAFFTGMFVFIALCLWGAVYMARAHTQGRSSASRWSLYAYPPIILAVVYAVATFDLLRAVLAFFVGLYWAHWASLLEITIFLVAVVSLVGWANWRGFPAVLATKEAEKIFLRESSEESLRHGRVWRTALGIPGIVDFMQKKRFVATLLFLVSNCLYAMALFWLFIYFGFFMYRAIVVLNHYNGDLTHPYIADTAVRHMVLALSTTFLAMFAAPRIGGLLQSLAQRSVRSSIAQLLETDSRAPILFLRAFNDDQVELLGAKLSVAGRLGRWLDGARNLDRLLLQEGTPYGPVVAIGNPSDKFPPYGAARGYFDDKTWQSAVADLAQKSQAIVICADSTEGVRWEIEHIAALGHLRKTLFLVHPKYRAPSDNTSMAHDIAGRLQLPATGLAQEASAEERGGRKAPLGLLGFFVGGDGAVNVGRSTTFSQLAYLLQVRWFLRSRLGFARAA